MNSSRKNTERSVSQIITAHRQKEGGGFIIRRPLPTHGFDDFDPFLLIDELGPTEYGPGEAIGAPDHPHRGFETITYFLQGGGVHEDSAGHAGKLEPGDVQWMTAGSGVVHSEMPSKEILQDGGTMHGFQVWVNLPSHKKMTDPRYQEIPKSNIPNAKSQDDLVFVKVIAGEALGVKALIDTYTPIIYQDWKLKPGAQIKTKIPKDHNAGIYVFDGRVQIGKDLDWTESGQLAMLTEGSEVQFNLPSEIKSECRFLLLGGTPIKEPIARYGPFVMNTYEEIQQAVQDYQNGKMGQISR